MDSTTAQGGLPQPGDTIAGKYRIVRLVGEGGMGAVFEAEHTRLRQRFAIKVLRQAMLQLPDIVSRFEREARAAVQLRNPHVAKVFDVDVTPTGLSYMVIEFLEGNDLAHEIEKRGPLPVSEAIDYLLQACAGMEEAHALGIVHRDLKPSNLFLCQEGPRRILKVLDFGISKMSSEGELNVTGTTTTLGTPLYMSPEHVRSTKRVDARSDIWSLGVILYELLTANVPFTGETASGVLAAIIADEATPILSYRSDIPSALANVLERALQKKPEARFPTVSEFAKALAPFGSGVWGQEHLSQSRALPYRAGSFPDRSSTVSSVLDQTRTIGDPSFTTPLGMQPTPIAPSSHEAHGSQGSSARATAASWSQSSPALRSGWHRKRLLLAALIGAPVLCLSLLSAYLLRKFESAETQPSVSASRVSSTVAFSAALSATASAGSPPAASDLPALIPQEKASAAVSPPPLPTSLSAGRKHAAKPAGTPPIADTAKPSVPHPANPDRLLSGSIAPQTCAQTQTALLALFSAWPHRFCMKPS